MISPEDKFKKPIESSIKEAPIATPPRPRDQTLVKLSKAEKSEKKPAEPKDEKLLAQINRHLSMIDQFE